jgi:ferredoxin-NADP reductase
LVGFFFSVHFNVTVFGMMSASTPELALVMGNVFSYIVSPKRKLILALKERKEVARNTFELLFTPKNKFNFLPGQFLEWTFPHKGMDTRGARRYFTIASSPTEETIDIGIRYTPEASSSFKRALNGQNIDQRIIASQLAGEFVMPKDKNQKLVFIAGGIGITPFRSMIKYLLDTNEKRDIVLFYSNKTEQEIAYRDIFDQAVRDIGIKVLYVLTDLATPQGWTGKRGFVNAEMIKAEVSDYTERMFYISGPHGMVTAFEHTLADLGVPGGNIKVDFFPGFA